MQRKAHQRALFGERNLRLCLASHARILLMPVIPDPTFILGPSCNVWFVMLKDELHSVPFLTTLEGKSA